MPSASSASGGAASAHPRLARSARRPPLQGRLVHRAAFRRRFARKIPHSRHLQVTPPVRYGREGICLRWRTDMLSIRIVTAGAVLAFAVSTAVAQDSDTPGQPGSLLKMLMHASEPTNAPEAKLEAKHVAPKPIRTARHFHHHAARIATATEDQ